jgi:CheY-specific phosphatase CheX
MNGLEEEELGIRLIWDTAGELANLLGTDVSKYLKNIGYKTQIGTPMVFEGSDHRVRNLGGKPALVIPITLGQEHLKAYIQLQMASW